MTLTGEKMDFIKQSKFIFDCLFHLLSQQSGQLLLMDMLTESTTLSRLCIPTETDTESGMWVLRS